MFLIEIFKLLFKINEIISALRSRETSEYS
jgi:hypothetical protein